MSDFKRTDFVQVEHEVMGMDNVSSFIWRNALYLFEDKLGNHNVLYTDEIKECIPKVDAQKIRKVKIKDD